jgi:hypothetical protein
MPATAAAPGSRIAGRQQVAARAATTLVFTGVQAWAIVLVVGHVQFGGAARMALAAVLAAAIVTVLDSWRDVWAAARPAATIGGWLDPRERAAR